MWGRCDVIVVGAGPAACATAIQCQRAGKRVAMFAGPGRPRRSITPETLSAHAARHWRAIGFDDAFAALGFRRHRAMASAWGTATLSTRHAICDAAGPGWYVDRAVLDRALLDFTAGQVELHPELVSHVERLGGGWAVASATARVTGHVIVDATGRRSWVARRLGARRVAGDRQVCFSVAATGAGAEALVESGPDGWWFSAPTGRGQLGVSWFSRPGCFRSEDVGPAGLAARLAATVHTRARIAALAPEAAVAEPARTDWLEPCAGDGWFAVGDAAMACDPLSSMGVMSALDDAEQVAALVEQAGAAATYRAAHAARLDQFLRTRAGYYAREQRWPGAPFWTVSKGR